MRTTLHLPLLLVVRLHVLLLVAGRRRHEHEHDERGDVPGWVLVTVMSAGIVAVLYGVARDELTEMLRSALAKVQ